jgi:hypothetical protein
VNHTVDGNPEDLNPSQVEELEVTQELPAAQLPETKIPLWARLSQLVEVAGT